jgi:hypothetical protein
VAVVCAVIACTTGCGKKSGDGAAPGSADLAGLAAVPASAEVVIGFDVGRIASSPLVERAIEQLLQRDAELATRWQRLQDSCKLDLVRQVKHVWLAIGPNQPPSGGGSGSAAGKPGTGPTIVIATGQLGETDLAACVRAMVGQGGGALTARDVGGRTLYQAKDGSRTMFFAFGRPDTVVLGANEAYVTDALGTGTKIQDDVDMKRVLALADQNAPVWAAGRVDPRVRSGLVQNTGGKLTAGPLAFVAALDLSDGVRVQLGAVMANAADAKALETFANAEIGTLAMFGQARSLQRVIDKVEIHADDTVVRFVAKLSMDDINQVLSALDGGPAPEQGSAPPGP